VADDRGGGSVILPGPNGSELADQDFSSLDFVGRARHDLGRSFVSLLVTDKEIGGGGSNRVFGPDFRFSPTEADTVTGQLLFSRSETPVRPELAAEWDGRTLSGHGADVWWAHSTEKLDWGLEYKDFSDGFRADLGFVPQVGFREGFFDGGWTFRPKGFVSRLRTFFFADYVVDREGALLSQVVAPGFGLDGKYNSFARLEFRSEKILAGSSVLPRSRVVYSLQAAPVGWLGTIAVSGSIGEEIDFVGARRGHGGRVAGSVIVRPGNHLELDLRGEIQWMNVKPEGESESRRLFTAYVERLKATYTLSARSYARVIGQYVETRASPALYAEPVAEREGSFSASVLLAYKLNWQSVVFLGYGDSRTLSDDGGLPRRARQLFLKVSYASRVIRGGSSGRKLSADDPARSNGTGRLEGPGRTECWPAKDSPSVRRAGGPAWGERAPAANPSGGCGSRATKSSGFSAATAGEPAPSTAPAATGRGASATSRSSVPDATSSAPRPKGTSTTSTPTSAPSAGASEEEGCRFRQLRERTASPTMRAASSIGVRSTLITRL
jgi:hypothetical protein